MTIDTLRADRVGAYGSPRGLTPTIDRLAAEGLRFEHAYAHVPLTLPSHASLMTGAYPTRNGVRDNGTFRLGDASPTLAAALKAAGYRTGAFVGAFVLDARFGLNRGFDVYDDRMLGSSAADLELVQRTAEQVLAPAQDWIRRARPVAQPPIPNPQSPVPGSPGSTSTTRTSRTRRPNRTARATPPSRTTARSRTPTPRSAASSRASAPPARSRTRWSSIASDHGESLGEHGERTHGLFAYDATLRVPLVMWAGGEIRPGVFRETTRLVDVAPTVLDLVGAAPLRERRRPQRAAVRRRRAAVRRPRLVLRSAERQPDPQLGAADRHRARAAPS